MSGCNVMNDSSDCDCKVRSYTAPVSMLQYTNAWHSATVDMVHALTVIAL